MAANVFPVDAVTGAPSYTGRMARQTLGALVAGVTPGRPLGARSGVAAGTASTTVTVTSTTWTVAPHKGVLDLEANGSAGPYFYSFDSNQTGSVTAANATNPRVDLLSVQLSDPAEGDGTAAPGVAVVYAAGTAAPSPVAPAVPARAVAIALINVPAAGGGSPTVTWLAAYTVASGGVMPCQSAGYRPGSPYVGQYIDDPTVGLMRWNGTNWMPQYQSGNASPTILAGNAGITGTTAFPLPYAVAPQLVVPEYTGSAGIDVSVTAITTSNFSWRAFATGGVVGVNTAAPFTWVTVGGL